MGAIKENSYPFYLTKNMKKLVCIFLLLIVILSAATAQEVVKVGAFNFYPGIFQDTDGKVKGFYVDALNELGEKENIKFIYVYGTWDEGLERIKTGEVDLLTSVAITEERLNYMDFASTPLITVWSEVYTNQKSEIQGIMDLEGKKIAVMKSDINAAYLMNLTKKLAINCEFVETKDFEEVFKLISGKKVDAGVVNNTFGAAKSGKYGLLSSGVIFNPFEIYFTVKKDSNEELLKLVNKYLHDWKQNRNSVFNTARQKWSHENVGAIEVFPKWLKKGLYFVLLVVMVLIAFITLLRYKVRVATEKAKESERLKSAFLANMSHEIRTPMNGILGFAELLKEPNLRNDKQQSYVDIIVKSGARMLNIINDIVDISKIESGQMIIHNTDLNVNKILDDLYDFFKEEAKGKTIKLSLIKAVPENRAELNTDSDKFYAILSNLLKNAIKYTNSGSIEFGYNLDASNTELEFYIKDSGIGIPQDRQQKIFERFIQADIEDKMALQGAGLGLSISKSYVEMLGGRIWVESEFGKGSTFFFTLPFQNNTDEENIAAVGKNTALPENQEINAKLLIVEDDDISSQFLVIALQPFVAEIINANTGKKAIELMRNNPDIDLILMDIQMPEMNGYEATRQIRTFNKDIVIIAQTAFAQFGDKEKAIKAGCNDYISKPIKKDELLALIQKYSRK